MVEFLHLLAVCCLQPARQVLLRAVIAYSSRDAHFRFLDDFFFFFYLKQEDHTAFKNKQTNERSCCGLNSIPTYGSWGTALVPAG